MPITVQCVCGKAFKVRDDLLGQQVTCQVCGANVQVQAESTAAAIPPPLSSLRPEAPSATNADTMECPACAERIPQKSRQCPLCKEPIRNSMTPDEIAQALQEVQNGLAAANAAQEAALAGGFLNFSSKILIGINIFFAIGVVLGMMTHDGGGIIAVCIIVDLPFAIALLVALANDFAASKIKTADGPDVAYKRFFKAVQTGRARKAFAALVPTARQADHAPSIKFNNSKIAHNPQTLGWKNPDELKSIGNPRFSRAPAPTPGFYA